MVRNRVHGAMSRMFAFACERGILLDNPSTRIRKLKETSKNRILSDSEIKLLWEALSPDSGIDIYLVTKLILKMLLLTGQRPGEVSAMPWSELDLKAGVWEIPPERMKGGEFHRVPIAGMALEVINQAKTVSGDRPYVFCSSYKEDAPVTRAAVSRSIIRHWKEIGFQESFTPHDLRRTVRTKLAELKIDDVVAERVLGHKLQGVLAVYNRYSYDAEKRAALEQWENKLRSIIGINESIA